MKQFGRKFEKDGVDDKLIPFEWSKDRTTSYESFAECLTYWAYIDKNGVQDEPRIDLYELFNFTSLFSEFVKYDKKIAVLEFDNII